MFVLAHAGAAAATNGAARAKDQETHQQHSLVLAPGNNGVHLVIQEVQQASHDTRLLRFKLPSPQHRLGLQPGQHITVHLPEEGGALVSRPYTPITSDTLDGDHVDLLIKVYPQGEVTQLINNLAKGDSLLLKGPHGHFVYHGSGVYTAGRHTQRQTSHIIAIAAGTGITPIFGVVRAALSAAQDPARVTLIYACRSEQDMLLKSELETLAEMGKGRLKIVWVLSQPSPEWQGGHKGRLTPEVIAQLLGSPAQSSDLALVCGPPGFVHEVSVPALTALGFSEDAGTLVVL